MAAKQFLDKLNKNSSGVDVRISVILRTGMSLDLEVNNICSIAKEFNGVCFYKDLTDQTPDDYMEIFIGKFKFTDYTAAFKFIVYLAKFLKVLNYKWCKVLNYDAILATNASNWTILDCNAEHAIDKTLSSGNFLLELD